MKEKIIMGYEYFFIKPDGEFNWIMIPLSIFLGGTLYVSIFGGLIPLTKNIVASFEDGFVSGMYTTTVVFFIGVLLISWSIEADDIWPPIQKFLKLMIIAVIFGDALKNTMNVDLSESQVFIGFLQSSTIVIVEVIYEILQELIFANTRRKKKKRKKAAEAGNGSEKNFIISKNT